MMRRSSWLLLVAAACYPTTTRPAISPLPGGQIAELALAVPAATRALALALDSTGIPVRRTEPKDGWLESEWFDAGTLKPVTGRILGTNAVKVRAWIDPSKPDHVRITVETAWRPMVDPSRDPRTLERQTPADHPIAVKVQAVLNGLTAEYGGGGK
jgi:hypothetical protein